MTELLPCPFCGGEAEMLTAESMNGGYLFGIMCNDCRSRGDVYDTEAEAIAAWNSRAERTCKMQPSPFTDWAGLNMRIVAGWYCENCGECCLTETTIDDDHPTPNYCPNCGAKVVDE